MKFKREHWSLYPLLFLFINGMCLSRSRGNYRPVIIAVYCIAFYLFAFELFWPPVKVDVVKKTWLAQAVLVGFAIRLAVKPLIIYHYDNAPYHWVQALLWIACAGTLLRFLIKSPRALVTGFWVAGLAFVTARILTLGASPNPFIDVYVWISQACRYFMDGKNPYVQNYVDIYLEAGGQSYYPPTFNYPPGLLFWCLPFEKLFHDIRGGYVMADVVTAICLYFGAKRLKSPRFFSETLALLWLAFPVGLFTLEQAWVDALLVMGTALMALALLHGWWIAAGIAVGFTLGVKQYSLFVALFAVVWVWRSQSRKIFIRFFIAAVGTTSALYLPFLLAAPGPFYYSVVQSLLNQPRRMDSFSLTALLNNQFLLVVPNSLVTLISGVGFLALFLPLILGKKVDAADYGRRLVVLYGIVFLCGKQAFCNYYQFLAFLLLLHIGGSATIERNRANRVYQS